MNIKSIQKNLKQLSSLSANLKPSYYQQTNSLLEKYANLTSNRVTLRQLVVSGRNLNEDKIIRSANYVRTELPIRFAHRIRDFQNLPFIVGSNPHMESIYNMYWEAFEKFQAIPEIKNLEDNKKFCMVLKDMLDAHIIVIQKFAMGIRETACHMEPHQCDKFLNEMLRSRIGRRVISQQHLRYSDIWEGRYPEQKHVSGIINTQCSALETVQKCTDLAGRLFKDNYQLNPPHVEIEGHFGAKLTYISGHLQYIIYELLKNSMQHTVKKHSKLPQNNKTQVPSMAEEAIAEAKKIKKTDIKNSKLPPIKVTIGQSDTEVMFRISDQGGGIPNDLINNVWSYWYVSDRNQTNFEEKPHLENLNLGMGLCIARAYANYWGGSISLASMHGYGTDAYVKISTENEKEVTESKVRSNK